MHTDWVNDIVLCENGTCGKTKKIELYTHALDSKKINLLIVVSASSDRTIKLWKPNSSDSPKVAHTIGWHTDYAKCLTYASKPGWVASGGLDRRINIWDIEKAEATLSIDAGPVNHYSDGSSDTNSTLYRI